MNGITTHVLDTSRGRPAAGVLVTLEIEGGECWTLVGKGTTNEDGRVSDLVSGDIVSGVYRLIFDTATYFASQNVKGFYPQVTITFKIEDANQHYHVPLLLSPFGYSTYRGS
ncbi:MAG TPA: hydroxyisourate hydrolase [Pyrinomonadaceae bacterium]|jgi:5-hydroxyisourate hydrolase|nr:hydroxyisourate hydrolase [Pyrinomonadaceae bacterium]